MRSVRAQGDVAARRDGDGAATQRADLAAFPWWAAQASVLMLVVGWIDPPHRGHGVAVIRCAVESQDGQVSHSQARSVGSATTTVDSHSVGTVCPGTRVSVVACRFPSAGNQRKGCIRPSRAERAARAARRTTMKCGPRRTRAPTKPSPIPSVPTSDIAPSALDCLLFLVDTTLMVRTRNNNYPHR